MRRRAGIIAILHRRLHGDVGNAVVPVDMIPMQVAVHGSDYIAGFIQQTAHFGAVVQEALLRRAFEPRVAAQILIGKRMMLAHKRRQARAGEIIAQPGHLLSRQHDAAIAVNCVQHNDMHAGEVE